MKQVSTGVGLLGLGLSFVAASWLSRVDGFATGATSFQAQRVVHVWRADSLEGTFMVTEVGEVWFYKPVVEEDPKGPLTGKELNQMTGADSILAEEFRKLGFPVGRFPDNKRYRVDYWHRTYGLGD